MNYKMSNIKYLTPKMNIENLCFYDGNYYFSSTTSIPDAQAITEDEFIKVIATVMHTDGVSEPEPTLEPQLTETEQAILETAINVDYLVCMKELEI
nr:MAG TPA: hypothetical protein [Caudoviricetes sp.]